MQKNKFRWGVFLFSFSTLISQIIFWILYINNSFNIIVFVVSSILFLFFFISTLGLVIKYDQVKLQTVKDSLTDIYNRRHTIEVIDREIDRSKRNGTSLGLILFDIDNFKSINDNYGHYTGDQVLQSMTQYISETVRKYDTFGRLGGEEFAIVLPETNEQETREIAERVRVVVEKAQMNRKFPVTISIGCSLLADDDDKHSLYKRTDDAMYIAKENGKNQVCYR